MGARRGATRSQRRASEPKGRWFARYRQRRGNKLVLSVVAPFDEGRSKGRPMLATKLLESLNEAEPGVAPGEKTFVLTYASGMRFPGFMNPSGSSAFFTWRSNATPVLPRSYSKYGLRMRPMPWWWEIPPPFLAVALRTRP